MLDTQLLCTQARCDNRLYGDSGIIRVACSLHRLHMLRRRAVTGVDDLPGIGRACMPQKSHAFAEPVNAAMDTTCRTPAVSPG